MAIVNTEVFLAKGDCSSLGIRLGFSEGGFNSYDPGRSVAWELDVEGLTFNITHYLPLEDVDQKAALASVPVIFSLSRAARRYGSACGEFANLAAPASKAEVVDLTGLDDTHFKPGTLTA